MMKNVPGAVKKFSSKQLAEKLSSTRAILRHSRKRSTLLMSPYARGKGPSQFTSLGTSWPSAVERLSKLSSLGLLWPPTACSADLKPFDPLLKFAAGRGTDPYLTPRDTTQLVSRALSQVTVSEGLATRRLRRIDSPRCCFRVFCYT